ncbi:MAG: hypothetical protein D4S01_02320 [Dehalococcoidia bacterium]|nr:MAG: hypothetical protein D4S01_02320 [Dehalococcoidia bacterium]
MSELLEMLMTPDNDVCLQLYKKLIKDRILYFNSDINDSLIDMVAMPILIMNEEEKDIPTEKLNPITIWLNTSGGDIVPTLFTVNTIKNSRIPIHIKALGIVASAGLYLTVACHHRIGSKSTIFLLHKGSLSLGGDTSSVEDTMEFFKGPVDEQFTNLIIERTKITEDKLKKIRRNETYVLGEEALTEYGFIDELY